MDSANTSSKQALRKELRHRRRALSSHQQQLASENLKRQLDALLPANTQHIGLYYPSDGEISPLTFARGCQKTQVRTCYLPRMLNGNRLTFCHFPRNGGLVKKAFGLKEVSRPQLRAATQLDVVLMPLVGFDTAGRRLGMGGGFYDRTYAYKTKAHWRRQPILIGLAHECQAVDALPADDWDVPLDYVVTDRRIIHCKPHQVFRKV